MADLRESFPTLEDSATKAGVNAVARVEGDASAAQAGAIGFAFKDSSNNVILPKLNTDGSIPTSSPDKNCKKGTATVAGVKDVATDIVTVALVLEKLYQELEFCVSSTRTVVWDIVAIDDVGGSPTETILLDGAIITGPGNYTANGKIECAELSTVGGTGVQNLVLRGTLIEGGATDLHGFIAMREL